MDHTLVNDALDSDNNINHGNDDDNGNNDHND